MKTIKNNNTKINKNTGFEFDYYDFLPIYNGDQLNEENKKNMKKEENNFFTRVPNVLAKANLVSDYGVNRIVLVVFILIHQNMSVIGTSFITIRMVLEKCNYVCKANKKNVFFETVKAILFLANSGYIEISQFDPQKINYDDCIYITINQGIFMPNENFTKLYWGDFNVIMSSKKSITNENLLDLFLYISAFIGCRPKNDNGKEMLDNPYDHPEAFWQSIATVCKNLSMARSTVNDGLNYLVKSKLLVKYDLGFKSSKIEPDARHYPNIYVLNKSGFEQEIEWAVRIVLKENTHRDGG